MLSFLGDSSFIIFIMFAASRNYDNRYLNPYLSEETLKYHFERHHIGYANNLIELTKGTLYENQSLIELINLKDTIEKRIYNNAAQIFNHDFYWNSLTTEKTEINEKLRLLINKSFGDVENFYKSYLQKASELFGSGWSWLVLIKKTSELSIINTNNADLPPEGMIPILVIDLWEHAYYIDYRNDRKTYIIQIIKNCLNWDFASENLGI